MSNTDYAVAPGEYLEEWAEDKGLSQQHVADLLGSSRKHVNEIINGRASISPDMTLRLERVTGIPARAWQKYEALYREDLARIADEQGLASHVDSIAPSAASYLRKIGATEATRREPGKLVSDFLSFHRCGTWQAYEHLHESASRGDYALAALKDAKSTLDRTQLTTWLRAGETTEVFERGKEYDYDSDRLRATLPELRARAANPDATMLRDISGMLAEVGVVFMVVDPPERFPLLGMTRWIDKKVPVIQQTGRWGKRCGFVIWTLFHEIGHVLNDPRGEMHLEYSTEKKRSSEAEKNANAFARQVLFGEEWLEPFRGLTKDHEIRAAAKEVGVAPGVAVHQLHRNWWLPYKFGNKLFADLSETFNA